MLAENLCGKMICAISPISRTKMRFDAYCILRKPIEEMMVNVLIELKNSKNIYGVWVNETADYCSEIGKGHMDFLGIIEYLLNKVDPNIIQPCPIKVIIILYKIFNLILLLPEIFLEHLGCC